MSLFFDPFCGKAPKGAMGVYAIDEGGFCACIQGERLSGRIVVNGFTRPEDLSWIREELARLYPDADLEEGIDLNSDGTVSGCERISDYNGDGFIGDEVDWRQFFENNRSNLMSLNGIFRWGAAFKPDDIIHDVIGFESDTYLRDRVQNAYFILTKILNEVRRRTEDVSLNPKQRIEVLLSVTREMGYSFGDNDIAGDLVSALNGGRLDCDTFAYIALAVSEELGWNMRIASAPLHVYMRIYDGNKFVLAMSYVKPGELKIEDEAAYIDEEGVTEKEMKNGLVYFRDLNRAEIKAMQLMNRGWEKIEKGLYAEAIKYYDLAISWNVKDPYLYSDKGIALMLLGRRDEAVENFKKALSLHKADWLIDTYLKVFSKDPSTAADYLTRASIYLEMAELPAVALENALKAKELEPSNPEVYFMLSNIYTKMGDRQRADEALKKLNELKKSNELNGACPVLNGLFQKP